MPHNEDMDDPRAKRLSVPLNAGKLQSSRDMVARYAALHYAGHAKERFYPRSSGNAYRLHNTPGYLCEA